MSNSLGWSVLWSARGITCLTYICTCKRVRELRIYNCFGFSRLQVLHIFIIAFIHIYDCIVYACAHTWYDVTTVFFTCARVLTIVPVLLSFPSPYPGRFLSSEIRSPYDRDNLTCCVHFVLKHRCCCCCCSVADLTR